MKNLWEKLDGRKTYAVALSTILYAVLYYGVSQHDYGTMCTLIFGSTGLGALRHSVSKTNQGGQ